MMKRKNYAPPEVLREGSLYLEAPILENSLVDKAAIVSVGQEVEEYDFSPENSDFNHEWE